MLDTKKISIVVGGVILLIVGLIFMIGTAGKNNAQNWQLKQGISGNISIVDKSGWYWKGFATVYTWPRSTQVFYSNTSGEGREDRDEGVEVTFNDGGMATVSTMVRFEYPSDPDQRLKLHRDFSGNPENVIQAVRAHLVNCLKNSAPLMSASENQTGRKAEYNQVVEEQLRVGLYQMRKVFKDMLDQTDTNGKPITVAATEIILDSSGKPIIGQKSPLIDYGIKITQFSITDLQYDKKTMELFATKKESFLKAEQSKAEREQEVQQRLMVEQKGLREKAEVEAVSNKEKAQAVIEAQKKVEVAQKTKEEAEMRANQLLSVAKLDKQTAETQANQTLEVAKIRTLAAEQEAKAVITLAQAEKEKIALAGAITEEKRILAEIARDQNIKVAEALSKIQVPNTVILGGDQTGVGLQNNLFNFLLLKASGLMPQTTK